MWPDVEHPLKWRPQLAEQCPAVCIAARWSCALSADELIEEYLAKAKEAEEQALRCRDPTLKESWQKIGMSYRGMAQHQLDRIEAGTKAVQPSQSPASDARKGE
jgi:hypothetical protein